MKNLFGVLLIVFLSGNLMGQSVFSESKTNLTNKEYESFSISENENKVMLDKKSFKQAIKHEMIGMDYEMNASNPDLLVSYSIYKEDGTINGDFRSDGISSGNNASQVLNVKKGTLLISVVDTKTGENLWTGLNDGVFADKMNTTETNIIKAVSDIFNQFNIE